MNSKTLLFSCLTALITASLAEPLILMPMGDSITQGGKADREEYTYRYPLQKILLSEEIDFDFVGSRSKGLQPAAEWPEVAPGVPFDPDHEGYYGNKTRQVVDKVITAWDDDRPVPDVVLIHLGTNDQNNPPHPETVVTPLKEFIVFVREKNPEVIILLGHLNFNDSEGASKIRPLVEALAEEMHNEKSPVVTVHHYRGWQENPKQPNPDTFDWAHPNPSGQQKMAEAWWKALKSLLQQP